MPQPPRKPPTMPLAIVPPTTAPKPAPSPRSAALTAIRAAVKVWQSIGLDVSIIESDKGLAIRFHGLTENELRGIK